jgi:hypothetical protein
LGTRLFLHPSRVFRLFRDAIASEVFTPGEHLAFFCSDRFDYFESMKVELGSVDL